MTESTARRVRVEQQKFGPMAKYQFDWAIGFYVWLMCAAHDANTQKRIHKFVYKLYRQWAHSPNICKRFGSFFLLLCYSCYVVERRMNCKLLIFVIILSEMGKIIETSTNGDTKHSNIITRIR